MKTENAKYDVFFCYRQTADTYAVRRIHQELERRGYRVFSRLDSPDTGETTDILYTTISESASLLLILSEGSLDRCMDESDRVRSEIEFAKDLGKTIIPIAFDGYSLPKELPDSLNFLRTLNMIPILRGNDVDDALDKVAYLVDLCSKGDKRGSRKLYLALTALVLTLCIGTFYFSLPYSNVQNSNVQKNLTDSLIAYMTQNLTQVDLAGSTYLKGLDLALQYVEGKSSDSAVDIQLDLSRRLKEINGYKAKLTGLSDQQREQLMNSPFPAGDLDAFLPALTVILEAYCDTLTHIRDDMLDNVGLHDDYKTAYIQIMREMAALDAELLFYNLNESLLPVTNESALSELKADILPYLPFINAKRLNLTHDETALKGNVRAVLEQYDALDTELEEALEREADRGDLDLLLPLMDEFIRRAEARGERREQPDREQTAAAGKEAAA